MLLTMSSYTIRAIYKQTDNIIEGFLGNVANRKRHAQEYEYKLSGWDCTRKPIKD